MEERREIEVDVNVVFFFSKFCVVENERDWIGIWGGLVIWEVLREWDY